MTNVPPPAKPDPSAGLTLVELMIVLVVVSIGILALAGVQTRSTTDVYSTGRNSSALAVAQARMETVRGAGFALARPDSGQTGGFAWWTGVDSVSVDLKALHVSVTWTEQGTSRTVRLDNLLSDR